MTSSKRRSPHRADVDRAALVQLSGGLDSAAAAVLAMRRFGSRMFLVFFDYGQPYVSQERRAAKFMAEDQLGFPLHVSDIALALRQPGANKHFVPARNLVFGMLSANLAMAWKANVVVVGNKSQKRRPGDAYSFGDSTYECVKGMERLVRSTAEPGTPTLKFWQPLAGKSKLDVFSILIKACIDPDMLWNCYGNGSRPCGRCYHCKVMRETWKLWRSRR